MHVRQEPWTPQDLLWCPMMLHEPWSNAGTPSRSIFIISLTNCSTAAVRCAHDDVVRLAVFNAVGCCQRYKFVPEALDRVTYFDLLAVHLPALCN